MKTLPFALALLLAAFSARAWAGEEPGPSSEEKARFRSATAYFQKFSRSPNPAERAASAKALEDAMAPGFHLQGARMLAALLAEEAARGAKREEDVRPEVLEAVVAALRRVRDTEAVTFLIERLRDPKTPWRVKFHVLEGLSVGDYPEVVAALREAAAADDPKLRIAALEALAKLRTRGILDVFLGTLKDPAWQVRIAGLLALRRLPLADEAEKGKAAEALIAALRTVEEGGRLKWEIVETLRAVTGDEAGCDVTGWEGWLARFKRGKTGPWQRGETRPVLPTYHGIEIRSTRVVFVVDITGSMEDPASKGEGGQKVTPSPAPRPQATGPRPGPPLSEKLKKVKEENDRRSVHTKMDAEKRELVNAILYLPPAVRFSIVFYSEDPIPWKPALVPATEENKLDAIKEIEKVGPWSGTDIYKSMLAAFQIHGDMPAKGGAPKPKATGAAPSENLDGPVDEIFLLTDGVPTVGEMTDPDRLCGEIAKINKTRKVRIHTIAVGAPGVGVSPVDLKFMKRLAEENGGTAVHAE